tara:strand:- start:4187 stop:9070 length:4884 start_codon:yes stop_codon:yes gene_type:complete
MRYFDKDSSHVKKEIIKGKDSGKYVANTGRYIKKEPRTHVVVGNKKKKVPIEHTESHKYPGGKGSRRIFKKEFAHLYTPYHAKQLVDIPVIRDLYSKYGNSEFMGKPFTRLTNKVIQRIVNRERAKKNYGPLKDYMSAPGGNLAGTLKAAVPDVPSRDYLNRYPLTRGRIKKEKDIENYLKGKDPVTKQPRYLSTHTRDLAKDPRFAITDTPQGAEHAINKIRKEHNPPLEKTISRYGTPKGTDTRQASISPTGRLKQAVDHFTKKTGKGQKFNLIKSRRQKREQYLNNIVLNNLSPELRKTAEEMLNRGTTFMQALHETFSMYRSPEMAKALSTWVRNMKHSTAENSVRKLRKMRKEVNDPDRKRDIDFELKGWDDDMRAIGVQSNIDGVIYGKWYDQSKSFIRPLVEDLPREYPLKQMRFLNPKTQKLEKTKFSGMNEGGIVEGYSKGGLLKDILKGTARMSRRKFLKGSGSLAASSALPMRTVAKMLPEVVEQAATRMAPPWIKNMVGVFENMTPSSALKGHTLPNGTLIRSIGKVIDDYRGKKQEFEVTNSDGYKVPVNMFKEKDGNLHIEFDIRDEVNNNQHIYMNKKTGQVEIVDENYYMTGPEDYAKDDPLTWDVTTPTQMKKFEKKMGLMHGDGDDYIKDYMSTPEGGDYSDLFESFIDSFSPSGSIFKTKQKAEIAKNKKIQEETYKRAQAKRQLEDDEIKFEEQFRGGRGIHGYYRGGTSMRDYPQVNTGGNPHTEKVNSNPSRFSYIKNLSDQEAVARMMMAEDSSQQVTNNTNKYRDPSELLSKEKIKTGFFDLNQSKNKPNTLHQGGYGVAHVINNRANHPNYVNRYKANPYHGISPIISVLSGKNQFTPYSKGTTRFFSDFKGKELDLYNDYYKYAGKVLSGEIEDFTGGADFFATPERIAQYDGTRRKDELMNLGDLKGGDQKNYFGLPQQPQYLSDHGGHKFYKAYNNGGLARRPEALPPLKGPDPLGISIRDMGENFIRKMSKGGFLKKAPRVLGKLTDYKAKIEGEVDRMYQAPKGPYTITNDHGAAVLDRTFNTLEETDDALKQMVEGFRTQDARTFRVFGARPPKSPEGVNEGAPEVDMGMRGQVIPPEEPGAMFWNSREKIVNAPSEAMQGNQWLTFMKQGKHGILNPKGLPIIKDQELNDTSLAPYLSQMGKQIISKEKLVKEFDEMAPTFEVGVFGKENANNIFQDLERNLREIDTQEIRNPKIKGFFDYMKQVINPLKEGDTKVKQSIGNKINEMIERNFGIKNALDEGVPQKFPFEIKEIIQQISTGLGKRTAGFSKYDKVDQYKGSQTLSGGDNYREILFKYKPGKFRSGEPKYKYAHDFGLGSRERTGGIVHTRVSDRTDQFGRRIMHIEEIQSDMHQQINMAQRALKKQHDLFEEQGMTPKQAYEKMGMAQKREYDHMVKSSKYAPRQDIKLEKEINANEQQMRLIQSKIEDLLTKPQNKATQIRLVRLNKERAKIRKILEEEKTKLSESTDTTGIPEGPLRKSEDYNEFVMKYLLRAAEDGGYDGLSISTPAIKNLHMNPGNRDYIGNLTAYGPIANGAMKKAAKKSGAKLMKTAIRDKDNRGWEVPMILLKENKVAKETIKRGVPIYKKGGIIKDKK